MQLSLQWCVQPSSSRSRSGAPVEPSCVSQVRGLTPYRLGEYEISRVDGILRTPDALLLGCDDEKTPPVDAKWLQRKGLKGVLSPRLPDRVGGEVGGEVHFLSHGDLKLAEFKQLLARSGYQVSLSPSSLLNPALTPPRLPLPCYSLRLALPDSG